jgi:hypothetical protein
MINKALGDRPKVTHDITGQIELDADAQAEKMQDWLKNLQRSAATSAAGNEKFVAESTTQGLDAFAELEMDADAAMNEWQAAIAEAERARKEASEKMAKDAADEAPDPADDPQIEKALSVAGTFNAAAVRGMGSSGPGERIAKATEGTRKDTHAMLKHMRRKGLWPSFASP